MSIPVELAELRRKSDEYGDAYVLTVGDDERPHVVSARPEWDGDDVVLSLGRGSTANVEARPAVALCYPPLDAGGFTLIVDGAARVEAGMVRFTPTGAVLHRRAPDGSSDCSPVTS